MGLVSSEVILVTQKAGTAKSAVPAFPFSHTSFNPLLPDEPVTDIIDRNPHSGYDSNIIDQPPIPVTIRIIPPQAQSVRRYYHGAYKLHSLHLSPHYGIQRSHVLRVPSGHRHPQHT